LVLKFSEAEGLKLGLRDCALVRRSGTRSISGSNCAEIIPGILPQQSFWQLG
jgi:hypothetical protein